MAMKYNRISADGHIECPPTAWVERMPKNLREFAPKVVRLPDGGDGVQIGNHEPAPLGLQLTGGQKYTEIIVFETQETLDAFKQGQYSLDIQSTAIALKSGAGAKAKYAKGVVIFTIEETGLMYQASVGGQKFSYKPR